MAKEIDHDATSATSTVGLELGKGALLGALIPGALGAVVGLAASIALGGFGLLALPLLGFAGGTAIGGTGAAIVGAVGGGALGALGGFRKVADENSAYQAHARSNSIEPVIAQVGQNAYMQGVQDGQVSVVQKLQEIQQQQSFAERVGHKKGAVTPESIAEQRANGAGPNLT